MVPVDSTDVLINTSATITLDTPVVIQSLHIDAEGIEVLILAGTSDSLTIDRTMSAKQSFCPYLRCKNTHYATA